MALKTILLIVVQLLIFSCKADDVNSRLDCYIENDFQVNENACKERNCIWDSAQRPPGVPICYLDTTKIGYNLNGAVKKTSAGLEAELKVKDTADKLLKSSPLIKDLRVTADYLTDKILRIKIFDPNHKRYEVPINYDMVSKGSKELDESKRKYTVDITEDAKVGFHLVVERKDTKSKIFDTSIGGLVFSDQFLQIATRLPSKNIYGLGEVTHKSFRHDLNYKTWGLFARDQGPGDHDINLMGVHPFYTVIESSGKSFGVFLLNSNSIDYTLLPEPALSLKPSGGILDFFLFIGDQPEEVVQLYTSLVGRTTMPSFWSLGFQLTRYGFKSDEEVKTVIERQRKENIPLDVVYMDIDYMDAFEDFTYDRNGHFKNLPQLMNDKIKDNIHFTLILDPAIEYKAGYIPFSEGYQSDVYMKWPKSVAISDRHNPAETPNDKDVYYGKVWPHGPAAFPDFLKNSTTEWWINQVVNLHKTLPFEALWIDMNEPSSFISNCPNNKLDFPAIRLKTLLGGKQLSSKTACMVLLQGDNNQYNHYDVHNLYGFSESIATQKAVHKATGKRGFIVSRSTYAGSGKYGAHWLGDNNSQWSNLGHSLIGILEFNIFGVNFVGADICGFNGNTNEQLCRQWSRTGAFYPFSRNHNAIGQIDQDPAVWATRGNPDVTTAARNSLRMRYMLLPYLYTLFYHASSIGSTVARPLVHEWPTDQNTANIWEQFLWGKSLLISPLIHENQKEVNAYLPPDEHWYDLNDGLKLMPKTGKVTIEDKNPTGPPPLHLRGGSIIPVTSSQNLTTTSSPAFNNLNLIVSPSKTKSASGDLFWDDKESIGTIESGKYNLYEFVLHSDCSIDMTTAKSGFPNNPHIANILIANTQGTGPISGTVDGTAITGTHANGVTQLNINLSLNGKHKVQWKESGKCNLA